jgi:phage recombination protein Bet
MVTNVKDTNVTSQAVITRGRPVNDPLVLTVDRVKREICAEPSLTNMEIIDFISFCQAEQVDPFRKEVYLVKIPGQRAYYVVAIQTYLKIAESHPSFTGFEAGVVIKSQGQPAPIFREGELVMIDDKEVLVGGWAKVYRSDRKQPAYIAVNLREYTKYTHDGKATRFWGDQPSSMIRKIALSKALREAFPLRFSQAVSDAEYEVMKDEPGETTAEIPLTFPEAFMSEDGPKWQLVYAKLSEMGLKHDEACQLLGIQHIKEDWLDKGKSIESFIDQVSKAKAKKNSFVYGSSDAITLQGTMTPVEVKKDEAMEEQIKAIKTVTDAIRKLDKEFGGKQLIEWLRGHGIIGPEGTRISELLPFATMGMLKEMYNWLTQEQQKRLKK